jgi:AcrR family transcriptional regulator
VTIAGLSELVDMRVDDSDDAELAPVLNAALSAFLDFGIRRTSMGEIAKRSGLSPATLYRRVEGKDAVVWAVGRREARRLIERVDAQVDPGAEAREQIAVLSLAFIHGLQQNQLLGRLLVTEPEVVLPLLTTRGAPVLLIGRTYLAQFIRRLQDSGELPAYDADQVAELVARLALSMALTPQTCLPLNDASAARAFALAHVAPLFGLPA